MIIARVIGNTVSTIKDPTLTGRKLLILRPADADGIPYGVPYVAVDTLDARTLDASLHDYCGVAPSGPNPGEPGARKQKTRLPENPEARRSRSASQPSSAPVSVQVQPDPSDRSGRCEASSLFAERATARLVFDSMGIAPCETPRYEPKRRTAAKRWQASASIRVIFAVKAGP